MVYEQQATYNSVYLPSPRREVTPAAPMLLRTLRTEFMRLGAIEAASFRVVLLVFRGSKASPAGPSSSVRPELDNRSYHPTGPLNNHDRYCSWIREMFKVIEVQREWIRVQST